MTLRHLGLKIRYQIRRRVAPVMCSMGWHKWVPTGIAEWMNTKNNFKCIRFGCYARRKRAKK